MEFHRILLDGDSLLYRCGFAAEGEEISHACYNLKNQLNKIKEELRCDTMDIFIKGTGNFRNEISESTVYKGTRPMRVPTAYPDLKKYIMEVHGAKEVDGMEADDAVSVELWKNRDPDSGVILAAMDKDLWNTPGWHFNYNPRKWNVEYIPIQEANRNFLKQLLTGDRTDNIPGLPLFVRRIGERYGVHGRVGPVKAEAFIQGLSNKEAYARIKEAYALYGEEQGWDTDVSLQYLREQGRLLWMTRELDEEGNPVLWEVA